MVLNKSVKPCRILQYCPYGPLVEQFPLPEERNERCCDIFGHECPVFHCAEPFSEEGEVSEDEYRAHFEELFKAFDQGD